MITKAPTPAPPIPTAPPLRPDLILQPGDPQPDGAPTTRILDPVRNRFFEVGWVETVLLEHWRPGARLSDIVAEAAARSTAAPTLQEAMALVAFLEQQQLLAPALKAQRDQLRRRVAAARPPWWTQLLHHYLFFRVPLLRPDAWLNRVAPRLYPLFEPPFLVLTALAGLLGLFLASRQGAALSATFEYFFNVEGLLFYAVAAGFAKGLHELGHAVAAKRRGLRVPVVGVAFLVMLPVLYTDTGETWKLTRRRDRFAVAGAGIGIELMLAAWTTLGWALVPDGPLRSALYLLATTTWAWTLAVNASPFMRFDGYFLLSDLVGMPNLHERSFALARRWHRRVLFGLETPDPEPALSPAARRACVLFAWATWLYRFVVFLGIAVLVYHLFFKLLGLFLMAVEIAWFIVRPVWRELREILRHQAQWTWQPVAWLALAGVVAITVGLVPVGLGASAPALARAAEASEVFATLPSRVVEVVVQPGQAVRQGERLVTLASPELQHREQQAAIRVDALALELQRVSAGPVPMERRRMLQEELGAARAELDGVREESARLVLTAPHDGVVRDLPAELVAGRWVGVKQPLLRVVAVGTVEIDAYLDEQQIGRLGVGQPLRFYPDEPGWPVVDAMVAAIDEAAQPRVPHPLLASAHGGGIVSSAGPGGSPVPREAVYRVRLQAIDETRWPALQVVRGSLRLQADPLDELRRSLAHGVSVLIRESGF